MLLRLNKKKSILYLILIILLMIFTGCLDDKPEDEAVDDSSVTYDEEVEEDENMEESIVEMTSEEKDFLCSIYSGEERIKKGKLFSYQEETLKQYRFAKEYLNEKYPGYDFVFYSFSPKNKLNPVTETGFREQDDETGHFEMIIEGEDGDYTASDTFYTCLLRPKYDEALTEQLHEKGIENCLTYTKFSGCFGLEVDGNMTVDEMIARGTAIGMKRDTDIFIDMPGSENEETEIIVRNIEEIIRNMNQYGSHTVYFVPGILDECSSGEECEDYLNWQEDYYHIQFDTFDIKN